MSNFKKLKQRHRELRDNFSQSLTLRVHRSLSWLGRAESEDEGSDDDVTFVLLWIAFNSAYAEEIDYNSTERECFKKFFSIIVEMDKAQSIYNLVWTRFPKEIRLLLDNQYVYAAFWRNVNGDETCANWRERMSKDKDRINTALKHRDTAQILSILFERLYVLRNQLVHGGATWKSSVNRAQVKDGKALLSNLMPIFIDILMDNTEYDWKMPFYTVIEA
ncbi:MAG: hypothetical protein J0L55_12825 [Caulobacterales bacterium]|nr:hypothetical protein [Caulobacterales bacterium]